MKYVDVTNSSAMLPIRDRISEGNVSLLWYGIYQIMPGGSYKGIPSGFTPEFGDMYISFYGLLAFPAMGIYVSPRAGRKFLCIDSLWKEV